MTWHASLALDYSLRDGRSIAHFKHEGPLRILQSLYPQGEAICHNILVHPPGGLVGGDRLDIGIHVGEQAHGLITTPGATRFYRSLGEPAVQRTEIRLGSGARLEWLPMEALCYSGCLAENRLHISLAPGAELLGWDITALGLPQADQPFVQGQLLQHIEVPGLWLERARIRADDHALMNHPLALAGHRCLGTLFMVCGQPLERQRRERLLEAARDVLAGHGLDASAGVTAVNEQVLMLRVLAPLVEPAMGLLRAVWQAWRLQAWQLEGPMPRIWST
ncbi:MAG: urease accessory protein UreD [Betaproteobacteria bacterium]